MRVPRNLRLIVAVVATVVLLPLVALVPQIAEAQQAVVINEVVSANSVQTDSFGDTPDWIELHNKGAGFNLEGWTIADKADVWEFPSQFLGAGQRLIVWASGRDVTSPQLHTNFKVSASEGETLVLASPDGAAVDTLAVPALRDDESYGRDESTGEAGYLISTTFGSPNSGLAPELVQFVTEPQAFTGTLNVILGAALDGGEQIRYSTNGNEVSSSSPVYDGPIAMNQSTVIRAAIVGNGVVGPEASGGYIAISSNIANRSSNLPIVLVNSSGPISTDTQDAVVSVIDREADGRARVLGPTDYMGFAGLRIRGASSAGGDFPKKQFKFELWEDTVGTEIDADLLGLGSDSDWVLYAPGRYDRAMINNAFMYQLGHDVGVSAPDYQFVELYLESETNKVVSDGDYQGLYMLRETVKIDDERVDIVEHTPTSSGDAGGYIIGYDWADGCCQQIDEHPQFGSKISVSAPGRTKLTGSQQSYIDNWWDNLQSAAASKQFSQVENYIDFEEGSFIDGWLLTILGRDVDVLRASHFMHKDAGGRLRGGPLWDFDRSMGGADTRSDQISDAPGWNGGGGHSYNSDIYADLWDIPEVQARLRSRWEQLRDAQLSDTAIDDLISLLGDEITEAYSRELEVWNGNGYGPRFGDGIGGELEHMGLFLQVRLDWLDSQFLSNDSPPNLTNPGTSLVAENEPFVLQLQASGTAVFSSSSDFPAGLSMDAEGRITGTVAYGDSGRYPITVTATNPQGASSSMTFELFVRSSFDGDARVILNEFNAVAPGRLLDLGGTDTALGTVAGNGGDWFEIVTIEEDLDMRGWEFELWSNDDDGVMTQNARLVLGQGPELVGIRAGSIVTVSESIPEDLSYDPQADDWSVNLAANSDGDGSLFSSQSDFDTNNTKWRLVVRDASGEVAAPIAGETEPWDDANLGVSSREVMALGANPSASVDLVGDYIDSVNSTFGMPNALVSGVDFQDFSELRAELYVLGDADCDGQRTIEDARRVTQYALLFRTGHVGCPLPQPNSQINIAASDVDRDGQVTINDAGWLTQCAIGFVNGACPDN